MKENWLGVSWFNGTVLKKSGIMVLFGRDFYIPNVTEFRSTITSFGDPKFHESIQP